MMNFKSLFTTVIFAITLAACGGGGGSGNSSSTNEASTQDLNGIYEGSFTQRGLGTFDLTGLVHNGRIIAVTEGANTIYDGNIGATSDSGFEGNVTLYEINGGAYDTASIKGNFKRRSFVSGSFDEDDGSSGTFSLDYDPIYERNSDLSLLNDVWSYTDGSFTVSVSIDPSGSFTGSDTDGCVYSGQISIIDSSVNIYSVDFTVTSCNQGNGNYSGFLSLADQSQQNDTMIVAGSNANFIFIYPFSRQ